MIDAHEQFMKERPGPALVVVPHLAPVEGPQTEDDHDFEDDLHCVNEGDDRENLLDWNQWLKDVAYF